MRRKCQIVQQSFLCAYISTMLGRSSGMFFASMVGKTTQFSIAQNLGILTRTNSNNIKSITSSSFSLSSNSFSVLTNNSLSQQRIRFSPVFGLLGRFLHNFVDKTTPRPTSLLTMSTNNNNNAGHGLNCQLQMVRYMNRNARRPKKANHGKRPVCNMRRREKSKQLKSRAYREKIFGFW